MNKDCMIQGWHDNGIEVDTLVCGKSMMRRMGDDQWEQESTIPFCLFAFLPPSRKSFAGWGVLACSRPRSAKRVSPHYAVMSPTTTHGRQPKRWIDSVLPISSLREGVEGDTWRIACGRKDSLKTKECLVWSVKSFGGSVFAVCFYRLFISMNLLCASVCYWSKVMWLRKYVWSDYVFDDCCTRCLRKLNLKLDARKCNNANCKCDLTAVDFLGNVSKPQVDHIVVVYFLGNVSKPQVDYIVVIDILGNVSKPQIGTLMHRNMPSHSNPFVRSNGAERGSHTCSRTGWSTLRELCLSWERGIARR